MAGFSDPPFKRLDGGGRNVGAPEFTALRRQPKENLAGAATKLQHFVRSQRFNAPDRRIDPFANLFINLSAIQRPGRPAEGDGINLLQQITAAGSIAQGIFKYALQISLQSPTPDSSLGRGA